MVFRGGKTLVANILWAWCRSHTQLYTRLSSKDNGKGKPANREVWYDEKENLLLKIHKDINLEMFFFFWCIVLFIEKYYYAKISHLFLIRY